MEITIKEFERLVNNGEGLLVHDAQGGEFLLVQGVALRKSYAPASLKEKSDAEALSGTTITEA